MATRYNYTGGIVTDGLVLNLDAAKVDSYPGTGTAWYDISGNSNNGTLTNGPTFSGIGKQAAIVFDGVDDKVITSTNLYLTNVTLNTWFYFNTQSNQICAQSWNYNTTGGFTVEIYDSNLIFAVNGSGTNNWPRYSVNNVTTGSFINITGTLSGNTQTLYVNGAPAATATDVNRNNAKSNQPITIGARSLNGPSTSFSNGKNSITQVYNRSLSQFEIFQNFNAIKGRYGIPDIVADGLVLNLDAGNPYSYLSGSSGTTWTNTVAVSSSISGSLVNGTTYSNGAIVFDGVDDYVNITRPSQIITSGSITISIWAKWTTTGTTTSTIQALVDNNHSSSPIQGFIIQDRPDLSKKIQWGVYPNTSGATSSFQVGDGTWRHIVGTYESGSTKLYINGSLDGFSTQEPNMSTVQPNITLGKWQFGNSRYLNGTIASTQIYNRALSAAEVSQNFNALRGRYGI